MKYLANADGAEITVVKTKNKDEYLDESTGKVYRFHDIEIIKLL